MMTLTHLLTFDRSDVNRSNLGPLAESIPHALPRADYPSVKDPFWSEVGITIC